MTCQGLDLLIDPVPMDLKSKTGLRQLRGGKEQLDLTPTIPGAIHGVRSWNVLTDEAGKPGLYGLGPTRWVDSGEPTVAECDPFSMKMPGFLLAGDAPPHPHCSCGLYAYHAWPEHYGMSLAESGPDRRLYLRGVVEAWGRIELHRNGFRAQFARPIALLAPRGPLSPEDWLQLEQLARIYEVELIWPNRGRTFKTFIEELGPGLDPHLVEDLVPDPSDGMHQSRHRAPRKVWWFRWIVEPVFTLLYMIVGITLIAIYYAGAFMLAMVALSVVLLVVGFTVLFLISFLIRLF